MDTSSSSCVAKAGLVRLAALKVLEMVLTIYLLTGAALLCGASAVSARGKIDISPSATDASFAQWGSARSLFEKHTRPLKRYPTLRHVMNSILPNLFFLNIANKFLVWY